MNFRVSGIKIEVSFLFAAIIALLFITDKTGLFAPSFLACLIHETGHLAAMKAVKSQVKSISLKPAAVEITRSPCKSAKSIMIIQASGPLSNITVFAVFLILSFSVHCETLLIFAVINLAYGAFNLLPVKGLDGGNLLYTLVCRFHGAKKAETALFITTALAAVFAVFLSVCSVIIKKPSIPAAVTAVYFIISIFIRSES